MYFEILLFTLIIITIILIIVAVYNNFLDIKENTYNNNNNNKLLFEIEKVKQQNLRLENDIKSISSTESNNNKIIIKKQPLALPPAIADPNIITDLDYRVTFDPLTEPSRRPPRHVISPVIGNPYFNYPTRGYTDSYSLQGYLVKDYSNKYNKKENTQINSLSDKGKHENLHDHHNNNEDKDKILKLFGREKYPNSTEYEYYVIINTGMNDYIKYFLENQRKELYDGDSVYIDILKSNYTLKTLKNKTFEYNPYLI